MLNEVSTSQYNAGGVATIVGYSIAQQGDLTPTNSATDLAIQGNGFFVVENASGDTYLTRAGSFTQNANGDLVNASGYTLLGYPISAITGTTTDDTLSQLVPVSISTAGLAADPSTSGTFIGNLPSNATIDAGTLPSANTAASTYTDQTSLVAYDDLGNAVSLDVYFTKTGTNTWEADVFDAADAAPGGGFPYSAGPITTQTMTFDPTTGALTSNPDLTIDVPNGQTLQVDVSGVTQLAAASPFRQMSSTAMRRPRSRVFRSPPTARSPRSMRTGRQTPIFKIPLATVASVNNLTSHGRRCLSGESRIPATSLWAPPIRQVSARSIRSRSRSLDRRSCDAADQHGRHPKCLSSQFQGVPGWFGTSRRPGQPAEVNLMFRH